jgi:hypothetical protein
MNLNTNSKKNDDISEDSSSLNNNNNNKDNQKFVHKNQILEQKKKSNNNKNEFIKTSSSTESFNLFGREQQLAVCQYCHSKIYTNVDQETSWFGICLSILILLFFSFKLYSIILIILVIPLTQNTIHSCPNCLNKIGVRTFYDVLSLSDNVLTLQIIGFGIIVTKKQLLAVFVFFLFGILIFYFMSTFDLNKIKLKETWDDYYELCLKDVNEISRSKCKEKFMYQDVNWKGYSLRLDFDERFFSRYKVHMIVKMWNNNSNEKEIEKEENNLYLKITENVYNLYKMDILNTTRGDLIEFNATFIAYDNLHTPIILEVNGYKKLEGKININPHVHNEGRYSVNEDDIKKDKHIYNELPGLVSDQIKK